MSLTPIQPDLPAPAAPTARPAARAAAEEPARFARELRAAGATGRRDRAGEARQVAEQLVATTFIEPVLTMLRETNQAAGPFAPGTTERRFTPLLDQHLSERIVHGSRFPLVDRIAESLLRGGPARADEWPQAGGFDDVAA